MKAPICLFQVAVLSLFSRDISFVVHSFTTNPSTTINCMNNNKNNPIPSSSITIPTTTSPVHVFRKDKGSTSTTISMSKSASLEQSARSDTTTPSPPPSKSRLNGEANATNDISNNNNILEENMVIGSTHNGTDGSKTNGASSKNSTGNGSDDDEECTIVYEQQPEDYQLLIDEMAESLDLTREQVRMDSLDSYVVVSVLTGTASFGALCEITTDIPAPEIRLVHYAGIGCAILSALAGIYATVIFSLCSAYGRSAIGFGRDVMFDFFMKKTGLLRVKGFRAYMFSLGSFLCEVILISAERIEDYARPYFLIGSMAIALYMYKDWDVVVDSATPIFTNHLPPEELMLLHEQRVKERLQQEKLQQQLKEVAKIKNDEEE